MDLASLLLSLLIGQAPAPAEKPRAEPPPMVASGTYQGILNNSIRPLWPPLGG